ncbi:MAG: benzodiazapine receptor [Planctomycetaceae bacterium]|jgi:benzodiazapine receptor
MGTVLAILGLVCSLASLVCSIIILIDAFKKEVIKGVLCLCLPFYILYYAFTQFEHEKKGMIIGGWLGGTIVGFACQLGAAAVAAG